MDEVDNIATYYLYTGDLAFVRTEWLVITRELAYNASLVDGRGLLITNSDDGQDWDYYNGSHAGAVTYYNDIYFETLTDAALMADALGQSDQAASYRQEAASLHTAINRYLFDPSTGLYDCPTSSRTPQPRTATPSPCSSAWPRPGRTRPFSPP